MTIRFLKWCKDVYNTLKKYIKTVVPKNILFKNEWLFRYFYGLLYLGKTHQCTICSKKLRSFIKLKNEDLLCPFCGSLSRNRRLWALLKGDGAIKGKLLHFSPSRSLYRTLKKEKSIDYYSSDFENEFLADYTFDITNIKLPKESFDTIICYHILEHVVDDKKAMSELYRIVKPGGNVYIQTPFKNGEIYEDFSVVLPEDRLKHFGQEDHLRIYSVEGLKSRLENVGFKIIVKSYNEQETDGYFGFKSTETVIIGSK